MKSFLFFITITAILSAWMTVTVMLAFQPAPTVCEDVSILIELNKSAIKDRDTARETMTKIFASFQELQKINSVQQAYIKALEQKLKDKEA